MTGMHTTLCSGGSTIPAGPAIGAVPFDGPDIADAAGNFPPDCTIAAGPQNLLVAVNGAIVVFNKNGTGVCTNFPSSFFGSLGIVANDCPFDPRVLFDEYIQRFWIIYLSENDTAKRSTLLVALSDNSDAAGGWTVFSTDMKLNGNADSGHWADFPNVGIDAQAVYFSVNIYDFPANGNSPGGFDYSKVRVMTKDQFINNTGTLRWYDYWELTESEFNDINSFTVVPAHMYGASASDGEYIVDAHTFGFTTDDYEISLITHAENCCDGNPNTHPTRDQVTHHVQEYGNPYAARQPRTAVTIDTGGEGQGDLLNGPFGFKLQATSWKNGHLFTSQSTGRNGRSAVIYNEMDVSRFPNVSTILNASLGGNDDADRYYPAIGVNGAGDRVIVYARSSPTEYAGIWSLNIPNGCARGDCTSGENLLQPGLGEYFLTGTGKRNRWGDYFAAAPDPDGLGIWIFGEYALEPDPDPTDLQFGRWGTKISLVLEQPDTTPPGSTSFGLSVTPNANGWTMTDQTITFIAMDNAGGSGIANITYSTSGAQVTPLTAISGETTSLSITTEGITTINFFATDRYGNHEPVQTLVVRIDKTAPIVSCGAADGQWHANDVSIACPASDAVSGLVNAADGHFSLSTSVPAGIDDANASTGTHSVCDVAGNCVTAGPVGGNKVDKKPPSINITQPTATQYVHSDSITLNYAVDDGTGSGVGQVTALMDGSPSIAGHGLLSGQTLNLLTELSAGSHTFEVLAADNVLNRATMSVTFSIIVTPQSIIDDVTQFLAAGKITQDHARSLLSKLQSAAKARAKKDCATAGNIYKAFINELTAQSGKKVNAQTASIMISDAQYLIGHCP